MLFATVGVIRGVFAMEFSSLNHQGFVSSWDVGNLCPTNPRLADAAVTAFPLCEIIIDKPPYVAGS
jgi:hypothetical protein